MFWHILLICFLLGGCKCGEPHCSRFHYDDQLLDKMIRLEVKVEAMEKEILKTNKQVLESLKAFRNDNENLKKDYTQWKKTTDDEIKSVRDTLLTPTVLFKARKPADISLETDQTIVFNKIMENKGDAYDNVTGIFTAPVGGTYLFTAQFCLYTSYEFCYGIMVDNTVQTVGTMYEGSKKACHTTDAMLDLETGQKVWVKCLSGSTSNVLYDTENYHWNTFAGTLIHL